MFGATQIPFHGKKIYIMFKQCILVSSVDYGEAAAAEPDLLANKGTSDWTPDC